MHGRAFVTFLCPNEASIMHSCGDFSLSYLTMVDGMEPSSSILWRPAFTTTTRPSPASRPRPTLRGRPIDTNTRDMRWPTSDVPKPFVRSRRRPVWL
jgi:hypothetical protein